MHVGYNYFDLFEEFFALFVTRVEVVFDKKLLIDRCSLKRCACEERGEKLIQQSCVVYVPFSEAVARSEILARVSVSSGTFSKDALNFSRKAIFLLASSTKCSLDRRWK